MSYHDTQLKVQLCYLLAFEGLFGEREELNMDLRKVLRYCVFAVMVDVLCASKILIWPSDMFFNSRIDKLCKLGEMLNANGHQVTLLYVDKFIPRHPYKVYKTVTYRQPEHMNFYLNSNQLASRSGAGMTFNALKVFQSHYPYQLNQCNNLLADDHLVKGLKKENFDILVMDMYNYMCGSLVIDFFDVPTVLYSNHGFGVEPWLFFPANIAYVPNVFSRSGRASIMGRFLDAVDYIYTFYVYLPHVWQPTMQKLRTKFCCNASVSLLEAYHSRVSIFLLNTDFSLEYPRPVLPHLVFIGGILNQTPKPLPPKLDEFVSGSGKDGFIVISFGTLLNNYGMEKAAMFARVFGRLPQRVVWRYDAERPTLAPNTLISTWIPQNDLLGHPKARLFISHCGHSSTLEAIYHGIPVVGMPFLFDQHHNAEKLSQRNGMGITLDFDSLTERDLHSAILSILSEPKFARNAKLASKLFRDPRTSPLDTMLYWFDYIIRYQGAKHLTQQYQPIHIIPLYQYFFLDVIAIAVAIILVTLFAVYVIFSYTLQIIKSITKTYTKKKKV